MVLNRPVSERKITKTKMKLLESFLVGVATASARARSSDTCDLTSLALENDTYFKTWDCDDTNKSSSAKPKGTKCYPICQDGYAVNCSKFCLI